MREKAALGSWIWSSILILVGTGGGGEAMSARGAPPKIAVGQEWSIKSKSPSRAKVVVGRIEPFKGGMVVHVSIVDIPPSYAKVVMADLTEIAHIPFEMSALEKSVTLWWQQV